MQRNYTFDTLRSLATIFVVILHLSATYVINESKVNSFRINFFVANTLDSFMRIAVPLFVMLSGRFLFSKQQSNIKFYKKRAGKILIPLIFWTIFYLVFTYVIKHNHNINSLFWSIVQGKPYFHLWYLYMLLGLYLFIPFLNKITINLSEKKLIIIAIVLVFVGIIIAYLEEFHNLKYTFLLWFVSYLGYFMLGYLLKKIKVNKCLLFAVYITSSLIITVLSYYTLKNFNELYFYKYLSPFVIIATISFYSFFIQLKFSENTLTKMAHLSFGIYLIHPMFEYILNKGLQYFDLEINNALVGIFLKFIIVFGLSYVTTLLISKIKFIKNII